MDQFTTVQRDLLYLVAVKYCPHGKSLAEELDELYDGGIAITTVYMYLKQLRDQGYLEFHHFNGRIKCYSLTEKSEEILEEHLYWKRQQLPEQ